MNRKEHYLAIVAEEGVEVAQRATKALRFGLEEIQPGNLEGNNKVRLIQEFNDLCAVLELTFDCDINEVIDYYQITAKKVKVEKYLEYCKELGTLDEA